MEQERMQQQQMMQQQSLLEQAGQLANSPMADPSKNPAVGEVMSQATDQLQNNAEEQTIPSPEGG